MRKIQLTVCIPVQVTLEVDWYEAAQTAVVLGVKVSDAQSEWTPDRLLEHMSTEDHEAVDRYAREAHQRAPTPVEPRSVKRTFVGAIKDMADEIDTARKESGSEWGWFVWGCLDGMRGEPGGRPDRGDASSDSDHSARDESWEKGYALGFKNRGVG